MKRTEREHLSIVDEDSDGDCREECKVADDESHSNEADENHDGDNDHVDGQA